VINQSNVQQVKNYITNQGDHHKGTSFKDEFRALCIRHEVELDERYIWD
jgi:putative transposase